MRPISEGAGFVGERLQGARHHLLVGIEAGIDRVDRHQRGQHRCAGSRGDQIADGDFDLADPARDRRAHFGVAKIEFRRLQCRLGGLEIGFRLAVGVDAAVEVALRDRARVRQLLAALEIALGQDQSGLGGGHLAFGARDIRRVKRRIDQDQQVALLDQRAFAEVNFLDRAGDAGTDFDPLNRLQPPGKLVPRHGFAGRDHRHRDRNCRRGRGGRLSLRGSAPATQEGRPAGHGQRRQQQPNPNQMLVLDNIFHG